MPDLLDRAFMLSDSARLCTASAWLERLSRGDQPDAGGQEALRWASFYLEAIGLSEPPVSPVTGSLAAQATTARPLYYGTVAMAEQRFQKAGLSQRDDVLAFLNSLLCLLRAGGILKDSSFNLTETQLQLASYLLGQVANRLLIDRDRDRRSASPEI